MQTLWQLVSSWPCDYASVERPAKEEAAADGTVSIAKHLKPPTTISIHLDKCRRCAAQKLAFEMDEKLKAFAELDYAEFVARFKNAGAEDMSRTEFEAVKDHASLMRQEFIGAPRG